MNELSQDSVLNQVPDEEPVTLDVDEMSNILADTEGNIKIDSDEEITPAQNEQDDIISAKEGSIKAKSDDVDDQLIDTEPEVQVVGESESARKEEAPSAGPDEVKSGLEETSFFDDEAESITLTGSELDNILEDSDKEKGGGEPEVMTAEQAAATINGVEEPLGTAVEEKIGTVEGTTPGEEVVEPIEEIGAEELKAEPVVEEAAVEEAVTAEEPLPLVEEQPVEELGPQPSGLGPLPGEIAEPVGEAVGISEEPVVEEIAEPITEEGAAPAEEEPVVTEEVAAEPLEEIKEEPVITEEAAAEPVTEEPIGEMEKEEEVFEEKPEGKEDESFFEEMEDESISLSGAELDNILKDTEEATPGIAGEAAVQPAVEKLAEEVIEQPSVEQVEAEKPSAEKPSEEEIKVEEPPVEKEAEARGPKLNIDDVRKVMQYLDKLFDKLPPDARQEFSESEYYDLYNKILLELGS